MKTFFFNKKTSHLRGECRHQNGVLGEFKRGIDVALIDWLGVREGTHLLDEHPLHTKNNIKMSNQGINNHFIKPTTSQVICFFLSDRELMFTLLYLGCLYNPSSFFSYDTKR
ncbi:hypothetical protein Hanom_Chr16g01504131 [Helianthus anomalus]